MHHSNAWSGKERRTKQGLLLFTPMSSGRPRSKKITKFTAASSPASPRTPPYMAKAAKYHESPQARCHTTRRLHDGTFAVLSTKALPWITELARPIQEKCELCPVVNGFGYSGLQDGSTFPHDNGSMERNTFGLDSKTITVPCLCCVCQRTAL